MSLAAGALSKVLVGQSVANLSSAVATGGTGPYTYQWYRSTSTGFSPGAGNLISGATALTLNDSGLIPNTTYYYVVVATDSVAATANSTQLTVLTEPSQLPNQLAQSQICGYVDMKVGSTNVISVQADVSLANASQPQIYPGQALKIVANTNGGIPKVVPATSKADHVIGIAIFNMKDILYTQQQNLEMAMWGSVVWQFATGAITQFNQVCFDPTYVGGVQATGNTATVIGWAIDGCAAAGLIRVMLMPNYSWATA